MWSLNILWFFLCFSLLGWTLSSALKRGDIADIFWGPGFFVLFLITTPRGLESLFLGPMIALWALRLGLHIGSRNLRHKTEDWRYREWRKEWGRHYLWRSYLQIWGLQGGLMILVAQSFLPIMKQNEPLNLSNNPAPSVTTYCALGLYLFGLVYETIADLQLKNYLKNKTSPFLRTGLWKYSRHPNYFGEIVCWWGIAGVSYSFASLISQKLWILTGAITITLLIRFVSGVPLLEKSMRQKSGYSEYASQTPRLLPNVRRFFS